jgi:hypothetical protein
MSHPHEYLLKEYGISIERLVPLTPEEIVVEAKRLYEDLSKDEKASERQIRQALIYIGKKEYPYRKAYEALCATDEEMRLQEAALKNIDPAIVEKMKTILDSGVHLTDYVNSKLFERDLSSSERYQVEEAILNAHDVIGKQCDERAKERAESYDKLVEDARASQNKMQALIDQLRSMAERDAKWSSEIIGKADQFEEGFSIVEKDPTLDEIQKEIENWTAVFEETEGDSDAEEAIG